MVVGLATALGVALIVSAFAIGRDCRADISAPGMEKCEWGEKTLGLGIAGGGVSILGILSFVALSPSRADVLDVVNNWNARYPADPIGLTP